MFLRTLKLKNFRNYSDLKFEFKKPITVLVGDNAQGKTNFLESIYVLATAKSTKADRDEELIHESEEFVHIEGELEGDIKLELAMQKVNGFLRKKVMVNGIARRVNDYSANLAVVLFQPEDINMVTGSPSLRRYFVDQTLSQVDRNYKKTISSYENIITRKNKVLKRIKDGFARLDELSYWTDQQLILGAHISSKRQYFFEYLNSVEKKFGEFNFEYLPSELTPERLEEYGSREIEAVSSLIGPHRDDFKFSLGTRELSKYGSRGEQRTAVLDLKLSEVSFIENEINDRPILLLDDIFSELDDDHRSHVIDISKMQQTVISTVEYDDYLKKELAKVADIYFVKKGEILEN